MYILSIPSFTWIEVEQGGENKPSPRAGHTCNLRDGQMVVVGGYVGNETPCDSPGIYVFNASTLAWASRFTALDHKPDLDPDNSVLANSFGYQVPAPVVSVIGGDGGGRASVTTPAAGPATGGPFATGKPPVFTVTAAGNTATVTQWGPGSTSTSTPNAPGASPAPTNSTSSGGTSPGLIVAGVLAGLAGVAAAYLGFCTWLYRRQVSAYQTHLAVANRYSASSTGLGGLAAFFGRKGSDKSKNGAGAVAEKRGRTHQRETSTSTAGSFAWVPPTEPKGLFDDRPTPESGYSSGSPFPPPGYTGPYGARPKGWFVGAGVGSSATASGSGSGTASVPTGGTGSAANAAEARPIPRRTVSGGSGGSAEGLLDGQEPSFFSVIMGPRRALRVVNGLEGEPDAGDQHGENDW